VASVLFTLVLVLLLIFIVENGQRASISYFGAHGHMPLGVALLFAAVLGILMVVIPGTARIVQLRIAARRHRRADAKADSQATPPPSAPAGADIRPPAESADSQ
jgi:lipopolysaccharide assembly protein A